ncbi:unnamed protein product [Schistosoma margrebowiei]|uniref:Uncharacterized protein n=1 Tax=Schistosoma margrebowiei TaxID=48269 RepID=A0A183LFD3_9TREM|nr:unnamed protein product [Schistosoma margrebowiei]
MKTSTFERKHGIQWTARNQLENLDFADDPVFLSHTHQQMQMKITSVAKASVSIGLNIHKGKSKIFKYNTENINQITSDGEFLEDMGSFTFVGRITDERGGSDADIKEQFGKVRTAFLQLKNI